MRTDDEIRNSASNSAQSHPAGESVGGSRVDVEYLGLARRLCRLLLSRSHDGGIGFRSGEGGNRRSERAFVVDGTEHRGDPYRVRSARVERKGNDSLRRRFRCPTSPVSSSSSSFSPKTNMFLVAVFWRVSLYSVGSGAILPFPLRSEVDAAGGGGSARWISILGSPLLSFLVGQRE